jgi:hypothetical protein
LWSTAPAGFAGVVFDDFGDFYDFNVFNDLNDFLFCQATLISLRLERPAGAGER